MQFIHFPLLSSWKYCLMSHTHFSNEIDVTLSLLDIWRTLGRNSVSRMSFIPLRCIKDRRHETNLQLIFPILQPVSNWEILQKKKQKTEFLTTQSRKMSRFHPRELTYLRNMLSVLPILTPLSQMDETVSTPSKTRRTFSLALLE